MRGRFIPCSPLLLAVMVCAMFAPTMVYSQNRVALVVGNGAYAHALKLPNPPNDAADMAAELRALDFEVISATDADKAAFDSALRDFARRLRGARTALFYYAGHGLQVAGKNYAVPIDARLEAAADLPVETVDIDQVLSVMQTDENRVNLVFLDACRDNPLTRSFARALPATRSASVGTGLSAVNAGRGTLIAYATAPNQVALDGARTRNSPFTAALLRHIATPGLDIALIMRRVTADVEAASGGAQSPWVHASLTTDVVLKGGTAPAYSLPPGPAIASVDPSARVAPRSEIAAPNEPLPADIPISPDVLKVVETHPFFANAPAVRLGAYSNSYSSTSVTTGFGGAADGTSASVSDQNHSVRWLRPSLVKSTTNQKATHSNSAGTSQSTLQTVSVESANGLISLGSKTVVRNKSTTSTVINKLLRIENMSGSIFPLSVGNRFSYEKLEQYRTRAGSAGANFSATIRYSCEVLKKYEARSFHPDLKGGAFLLHCDSQTVYEKSMASANSRDQSRTIYFEELGYWIPADPVAPREQLIANKMITRIGAGTSTSNGAYTLKSFSLAW